MKKTSFRQIITQIPKALALFVVGIFLAVLLIYLNDSGYLAFWQRIQPPPEQAVKILSVQPYHQDSGSTALYVQTAEGHVYVLDKDQRAGWEPADGQDQTDVLFYSCQEYSSYKTGSHPAFWWFRNQIADCKWAQLSYEYVKDNLVFVLLKDGKIYLWRDRAGLDTWLWTICITPLATMFLGLLLIRILERKPENLPKPTG